MLLLTLAKGCVTIKAEIQHCLPRKWSAWTPASPPAEGGRWCLEGEGRGCVAHKGVSANTSN